MIESKVKRLGKSFQYYNLAIFEGRNEHGQSEI